MWVAPVVHIQVGVLHATYIISHPRSTMSIQAPAPAYRKRLKREANSHAERGHSASQAGPLRQSSLGASGL
jgi:hypothetical protein